MKSIISASFFDKAIVKQIADSNIDKERLYNLLYIGKISLEEYLRVSNTI